MTDEVVKFLAVAGALSAGIAAVIALYKYLAKVVHYMDKQQKQEKEIQNIKEECGVLTTGMLACLKAVQKLIGKDDDTSAEVSSAIKGIEEHLNERAHR